MPRVAICFWRLGPYHHARLEAAAKLMNLEAIEFVGQDTVYAWDRVEGARGFSRTTLQVEYDGTRGARKAAQSRMESVLSHVQPDVVAIPGWSLPDALIALRWCARHQRRAILMSESTAWDERRHPFKESIKSRVVRLCSAALVGGTSHRDYVVSMGLPQESVQLGYDVVDNDHFAAGAAKARQDEAGIRVRLDLPRSYFLASARFLPQKNLEGLLDAYAAYRADHTHSISPWDLVVLGDGPLRERLERRRAELGLEQSVHFPGFIQYTELPAYYGIASAFVHVSTMEPWGLVVNEAMAASLPVVVSRRCGCARDLVADGVNGMLVNPEDRTAIAQCLRTLSDPSFPLRSWALEAKETVAAWSPQRFALGLQASVNYALSHPLPPAGFVDRMLLTALLNRTGAV